MIESNKLGVIMERTLIIIKPDSLSKKVAGSIISEFEKTGLKLVGTKMVSIDSDKAGEFYAEHKGKDFYEPLVNFMTSNPALVMVWEGEDAITRARTIIGATNPANAEEGTIRQRWGQDGRHNAVHGSDSPASAEREINFFFNGVNEVFNWETKEYTL
jgi:nucleoside-diphosphate kinase